MFAKLRYYPLYSLNPNKLISLFLMRSFLATFFVSILLISNGMLTTVIDVCCLNETQMNTEGDACCSKPVEPRKVDCCNKAVTQESHVTSHECCEFGSWYYFTPKYLEESTLKTTGSHLSYTFWFQSHSQLLDNNLAGSVSNALPHVSEISPPSRASRQLLAHHCTWII